MSSTDAPHAQEGRRPPIDVPEAVEVDQTFDVDGLHALRSTLAAHASRLGVSDVEIQALIIVASELATNAIRHGGGRGRIRLWWDREALYCQVIDDGPGITDTTVGRSLPPVEEDKGRGLWIARNLTAELAIEPGAGGRGAVVTAVFSRGNG